MTVREFVDAASKNLAYLDEELVIVTETNPIQEGAMDGTVQVSSKPLKSVVLGFNGLLLFVDPESPARAENFVMNLPEQIAGPLPKALVNLQTVLLKKS